MPMPANLLDATVPQDYRTATGCRPAQLFGVWAIEPTAFEVLYERVMTLDLNKLAERNLERTKQEVSVKPVGAAPAKPKLPYQLRPDGVAVVEISGPTTKHPTSFMDEFGGASTISLAKAINHAVRNKDVSGIMMHYDTPGGTVAGSAELVDAIRAANKLKPVWSHGSDLVASAGMLYATQGERFTANRTADLGSMGTKVCLYDMSGRAEKDGVKAVSIASGKYKAVGTRGAPVTEEQQAYLQDYVNNHNERYVAEIAEARKISPAVIKAEEAKLFGPDRGLELKLIDGVCSLDQACEELATRAKEKNKTMVVGGAAAAPGGNPLKAAARSRKMLTEQQLEQAKKIPGCENATVENADEQLLASASALLADRNAKANELVAAKAAAPAAVDPEALAHAAENAAESIEILAEKQHLVPAQAKALKALLVGEDGKPAASAPVLLAKLPTGKRVVNAVCDVLKMNKTSTVNVAEELSTAQVIEPPAGNAKKGEGLEVNAAVDEILKKQNNRSYGGQVDRIRKAASGN